MLGLELGMGRELGLGELGFVVCVGEFYGCCWDSGWGELGLGCSLKVGEN